MPATKTPHLPALGRWLCIAGAAVGALGLAGWLLGLPALTWIIPGQPPMKANTALSLLLLGTAGALRWKEDATRVSRVLSAVAAAVVLVIGAGTLVEYALHLDLRIDDLLMPRGVGPRPGRPSPPTAAALTCLALAILGFDRRPAARARPSEWLVLLAGLIGLMAATAQVLGAAPLYRLTPSPVIGVAVPTAVSLLTLSLGLLFERPHGGVMAVATAPQLGGVLIRRIILPIVLVPPALAFIVLRISAARGLRDLALENAILVIALMLVSFGVLTITAVALNRSTRALELSRARMADLFNYASDAIFVADREGRYLEVNDAGCRLLGMARDEIIGKTIADLLPPDEAGLLAESRQEMLQGGSHVGEWHLRHKDGGYIPVEVSARILPNGRWQAFARDIRVRRALEEEARRSKAKIEGIVSIATDAIISIDAAQRITLFNQGAEGVFGWSGREALGQPLDVLIPERYRAVHGQHVRDFAAGAVNARRVHERGRPIYGLRKDGSEFPAEAAISKLSLGDELTLTVVLRDITEQVRLEREMREARGFLENVLESSVEYGVVALDPDRRIVLWNEGARRIYGYSAQEIMGTPVEALHVESDLASGAAPSLYARALDRGSAAAVMRCRRKDGSELLSRLSVSPRRVEGAPSGYLVIGLDVSLEERRAKQERVLAAFGLLVTSSLNRAQLVNAATAFLVTDLADACIVDLVENPEDERSPRIRRVAHRDVRKKDLARAIERIAPDWGRISRIFPPSVGQRAVLTSHVTPEFLDSIARGEEHRRLLHELAPASFVAVPLQAHGLLLGTLAVVSTDASRRYDEIDVTFVEEIGQRFALALENVRLFEAATRAVAARDEVMGVVAHDLRNPLGAIRLQASSLGQREADAAQRAQARLIERAAVRMNRIIQDLLDVTSIEAGRLSVERSRTSTVQLLSEAVAAHRDLAGRASLEMHAEAPDDLPDVWADRDRLLQVLENLIGNAIKFTRAGGWIVVGAQPRGDDVLFWVRDTGVGLTAEELPHIFDRFWRAQEGGRRGAGLGLPIAKGIVEAHGGRLWVESLPGRGSTFFFTIPAAARGEEWRPEPAPP